MVELWNIILNYVFISKSGNTQVSANELNLLPFSKNNVKDISAFVSKYLSELREHQEELDRLVCEAYDLSVNEINMILDYWGEAFMKKLQFKTNSRHISQLGRELVTDFVTALVELIKNSYDADAYGVKIILDKPKAGLF